MSHIPTGGAGIHLAAKAHGSWWYHDDSSGWQGVTLIQAQPRETESSLVCVPGAIQKLGDGSYRFWTTITNEGPADAVFNLQVAEV
jgi:hypothetical protein